MRLLPILLALTAAGSAAQAAEIGAEDDALPQGCAPYADVVAFLSRDYAEAPVASGVANNGGLVEVFASPDRETWTLLITMPGGHTCMMAAGSAWVEFRHLDLPPPGPPEPGT